MALKCDGPNNAILDGATGLELAKLSHTASAVNELTLKNAATGTAPQVAATGDDTNIDMDARGKGAGRLVTPAGVPGTTATLADIGGGLTQNFTAVGNVGAGEDTLMSYTVPANVWGTDGDRLELVAFGTFAANANAKNLKLKFGATAIVNTGALGFNGTSWQVRCTIIRTGASALLASAMFVSGDTVLVAKAYQATLAVALSGTVSLSLTGEATADNDIVQSALTVQWGPGS